MLRTYVRGDFKKSDEKKNSHTKLNTAWGAATNNDNIRSRIISKRESRVIWELCCNWSAPCGNWYLHLTNVNFIYISSLFFLLLFYGYNKILL